MHVLDDQGLGEGELRPLRLVGGVAPAAGEDDDAGREVHRRGPVLDEGLETVGTVTQRDDAHRGTRDDGAHSLTGASSSTSSATSAPSSVSAATSSAVTMPARRLVCSLR